MSLIIHYYKTYYSLQKSVYILSVWYSLVTEKYEVKGGSRLLKSMFLLLSRTAASVALMVTTYNVNSCCIFLVHQPKLPNEAQKLRKF